MRRGSMKSVQAKIPDKLYKEAESLVKEGWFRDEGELLSEALRRFLDTHRPELMEKFIGDDVEWGLHGKE
jgi:Arc/MetJ-type ribon-helix-helix transcriptional regulator